MTHLRLLGSAVVFVAVALVRPLPGQEAHSHDAAGLMVLADGARDPEAIPDRLAYAHFILSVAEPDRPSKEQLARRKAMLAPVQLSTADQRALVAALRAVRKQVDEIERLSAVPATPPSRLDELRLQRTRVLDDATARLTSSLSSEGAALLDAYVKAEVKPKIVIYGTPSE